MSEPNIPGADPVVANGQRKPGSGRDEEAGTEDAASADPWFAPASSSDGDSRAHAAEVADDTGWFLRTGRAGLLPDSTTESWEETGHGGDRLQPAGAPPWAGDRPGPDQGAPPPWESGPWPGPGEDRSYLPPGGTGGRAALSPAAADTGNWQATAALGASVLPIVLPGLALGILGLRRSRITGTGRTASWFAIALSLVWAVILTVWLAAAGGTAASACGSYQSAVSIQVTQVLHDLATGAPQSVLNSDLRQAITQANTAAAQAQQVTARNAMASLTASLQQVAAEGSRSDAVRHQQVAAAAAAMASACKA
jgi:hypothetical protein